MADTKLISWKVSDFANSDGTWRSELYGFKYYKKEGIRGYVVNSNSRISLSAGKILFEESRFTINTTDPNTQDTIAYENKYTSFGKELSHYYYPFSNEWENNVSIALQNGEVIVGYYYEGNRKVNILFVSHITNSNAVSWDINDQSYWQCIPNDIEVKETIENSKKPTLIDMNFGEADAEGSGYQPSVESMFGEDAFTSGISLEDNVFSNINKISGVFGLPYQFLPAADTRLIAESNESILRSIGYEYANKIVEKMPLLLISPGRANFMTKYSKEEKKNLLSYIVSPGNAETTLDDLVDSGGRYYTFEYAQTEYYTYLNPMCRIAALFLGIGDIQLPEASAPLKNMDWREYTESHISSIGDWGDYNSIPFYLNTESSISENFTNGTQKSLLESSVNSISDMGKELSFLLGQSSSALGVEALRNDAEIASNIENVQSWVNKILGHGNVLSNLATHLTTVVAGGKLIFPEIWSDSSFSKSYRCEFKFIAPDPSPLSIYLNVLVPLFHLICMTCPQSVVSNPNGYTNPFIVKAIYKGFFSVDMGIITDMSVTKGEECRWTREGIPTSMNVSIEIKDLYSAMSITPSTISNFKYDTMSNTALMDYIATLCGVNIQRPEIGRITEMWMVNIGNKITDIVPNLWGGIEDKVQNIIMNFYNKNYRKLY